MLGILLLMVIKPRDFYGLKHDLKFFQQKLFCCSFFSTGTWINFQWSANNENIWGWTKEIVLRVVESGGLGQGNFLVFNNLEVILGEWKRFLLLSFSKTTHQLRHFDQNYGANIFYPKMMDYHILMRTTQNSTFPIPAIQTNTNKNTQHKYIVFFFAFTFGPWWVHWYKNMKIFSCGYLNSLALPNK